MVYFASKSASPREKSAPAASEGGGGGAMRSVVHDDGQEGMIDLEAAAAVLDEAQLLELVHEEADARSRRADHFRERLLRDPRKHELFLIRPAVTRQQQQRAGQPLLAGIEQLIDKVLFDANVPGQHVGDEPVREVMLVVEPSNHLLFRDDQHGGRAHGGRHLQANRMTRQRPLTEEITRPEHRHDGLLAARRQHRELDGALLDVQDAVGGISLGENDLGAFIGRHCCPRPCGTEKRNCLGCALPLDLHERSV